jgi:hypothetical protein
MRKHGSTAALFTGVFSIGLLLFLTASAQAQGLSTLRGTVMDSSRALVPGAEVTITAVGTNVQVRSLVTDGNGNFEAPDLKNGNYNIKVSLAGFKTVVLDNVVLESSQIRRLDVTLSVGEIQDQVTVEAGQAAITTDSAEISSSFKNELFDVAPLVKTYYPQALMATMPGIDSQMGSYSLRMFGQPTSQVSEGMDGVTEDGTVNLINNMLGFQELKVVAVNSPADQSRVANFNMTSKSGNNAFHGSIAYTHFNSALAARNFFSPKKTVSIEHRNYNEVSGPIIKDKTFFYGSLFYQRIPGGSYSNATVPTVKMRAGNFSQVTKQIVDPLNGQPFAGNVIPTNRLNAMSVKVLELYVPQPNLGSADTLVNNLGFAHGYPDDLFKAVYPMVRIDHTISKKNSIYGRFIRRTTPYVLKGGLPGLDWTRKRDHRGWVVSDTHIFNPRIIHTFRFGYLTDYVVDGEEVDGFTPRSANEAVKAMGLQGVNPKGLTASGFPTFSITGFTSMAPSVIGGIVEDGKQMNFSDSVSWATGRHVIKFGFDLKRYSIFATGIPAATFGSFSFDGTFTGYSFADFMLGLPRGSSRVDPLVDRTRLVYEMGTYITDTFKVSPKLTVDVGIRWDYFTPGTYDDGLMYNWDPKTGNVIIPSEAQSKVSPLYDKRITIATGQVVPNADATNLAPRIGAAYRLRDTLVIRGGYGIYTEQRGYFTDAQGGGPYQIAESYTNTVTNGVPLFSFPNPFPSGTGAAAIPSQSVSGYTTDTSNGMIHQFNISVEQEWKGLGFRGSYVGSRSRGLNYFLMINKPQASTIPFTQSRRPFPQFVSASTQLTDGASNYDSGQIQVQKRAGAFTFDAHYTLAASMSNNLNLQDPYNHYSWNREQYTGRHKFVLSAVIELPVGKGKRFMANAPGAVDAVFGGWKIIWLTHLQSGQFFSPSFSGSDPSNTNTSGGLPDRNSDGNLPSDQRKVEKWFDWQAFTRPPSGRYGNSGVNILEGPGMNLHHLSVVKNFHVTERIGLEFFLGISNLFNHPHFQYPRTDVTASSPAVITTARNLNQDNNKAGERAIEGTLKLTW